MVGAGKTAARSSANAQRAMCAAAHTLLFARCLGVLCVASCVSASYSRNSCTCIESKGFGGFCARWDGADETPWCYVAKKDSCGKDTFTADGRAWAHAACMGRKFQPYDPVKFPKLAAEVSAPNPAAAVDDVGCSQLDQRFQRACTDSLGFFDDIAEGDWCRKKQHSYDFPNIGTVRSGAPHAWYGNNFEPTFTCPLEERQGLSDGPKWLCDPHRLSRSSRQKHHCLVYSVGSANEFSFEESIYRDIGSHCEIHTFDPSVGDNPSNKPPYVHYHNWGISGSTGSTKFGVMKTLADTVKLLGHAEQHIELFKMDCEGCEWATYSSWFTSMKFKPRQMMIELHGGTGGATPVPAEQLLKLMRANHYVIYHKEINAMSGGTCIEYAFLLMDPAFFTPCPQRNLALEGPGALSSRASLFAPGAPGCAKLDARFRKACEESLGFFDHVSEENWCRSKHRDHVFPHNLGPKANPQIEWWYVANYEATLPCSLEQRQGLQDDERWVCDPRNLLASPRCLVYSAGDVRQHNFERGIHRDLGKHCEIHVFTTQRNVGQKLPYVKYHNWDISDTTAGKRKTLADTAKLLGHESVRIEIFKLDCDGCEFTVYNGLFTGLQHKPRQFLVDLHDGTTGAAPVPAQRFLMQMRANHYVAFHKEQAVQVPRKKLRVSYSFLLLSPAFFHECPASGAPQRALQPVAPVQRKSQIAPLTSRYTQVCRFAKGAVRKLGTLPSTQPALLRSRRLRKQRPLKIYVNGEPDPPSVANYDLAWLNAIDLNHDIQPNAFYYPFWITTKHFGKNWARPAQQRPVDVLYRSSKCDPEREALVSTVRESVEQAGLRFEYMGKCSGGSKKAPFMPDGQRGDNCPPCQLSKMMISFSRSLDEKKAALDEKFQVPLLYGATPIYHGMGPSILSSMGYNVSYVSLCDYADTVAFGEAIVRMAKDLDQLDRNRAAPLPAMPTGICEAAARYIKAQQDAGKVPAIPTEGDVKVQVSNARPDVALDTTIFQKVVECAFGGASAKRTFVLKPQHPGGADIVVDSCCWW